MPLFDSCVPTDLLHVQKWFGSVVAHPLLDDGLDPKAGNEAERYIAPSPYLKPMERIEIYNQQYWWRLLNIMQEAFPCVLRLFGYEDFNRSIAVPYLQKCRPKNWSLNTLGDALPDWIAREYAAEDKQLIYDAAIMDALYHSLFFHKAFSPISQADGDLSVKPLYLQPHVAFLYFPYKMTEFRKQLLKQEPSYWLENAFPELKKEEQHVLLFRNLKGRLTCKTISKEQWSILKQFQGGSTIDKLCEWMEQQSDPFRQEAETHLQNWFSQWTVMGILRLAPV